MSGGLRRGAADVARLLLGHARAFRNPRLQDVATSRLGEAGRPPSRVLDVANATLRLRNAASLSVYLRARRLASRARFAWTRRSLPDADELVLSLLCPTRGRPRNVETFLTSLSRTAARPRRVEILFYVDDDDPDLPAYRALVEAPGRWPFRRSKLVVGPSIAVPKSWNVLAERATGELLMMANDDQVYVTYGWDVRLDEQAQRLARDLPDGVYTLFFDGGQYPEGAADFPIVTRRWYETLGYFTPPIFEYWETEKWIFALADGIGRLVSVPGVFVDHRHYQDYKSPFDSTYQRHRRTRDKSRRDSELFVRTEEEREREAAKLLRAIGAPAPEGGRAPELSPEIRAGYATVIGSLAAAGRAAEAEECAQLAVRQGVWRHPLQRPAHYVRTLPPRPVYEKGDFRFVRHLEQSFDRIRAEVDRVTSPERHGFEPVTEALVGRGRWDQVVFWEAGQELETARELFPVTAEVLAGIPEATVDGPGVATLSWLHPGSHIVPHCGETNTRLRVHMGIRVPPRVRMRVGETTFAWEEGKCIVFDDSFEHEVWHDGDEPRIVLLLDVLHPELDPEERERLLAERASVDSKVAAFMAGRGLTRIDTDGDTVALRPGVDDERAILTFMRRLDATAAEIWNGEVRYERAADANGR